MSEYAKISLLKIEVDIAKERIAGLEEANATLGKIIAVLVMSVVVLLAKVYL